MFSVTLKKSGWDMGFFAGQAECICYFCLW